MYIQIRLSVYTFVKAIQPAWRITVLHSLPAGCRAPPVRGPHGQVFVRGVEIPRFWGPGRPRTPWRASAVRLDGQSPHRRSSPGRPVLADNFPTSSHNNPQKLSLQSSRHVLFAPPSSRKRPIEAETARNSFVRNILQGTSLFSIFCSATLPVNSRKQRFCVQSMGGGRWETTNLMRANSEQLAPPQVVGVSDVPALSSH